VPGTYFLAFFLHDIILKGLHSKAQGKGSKAEGRQPATLGEDKKMKIP
jgi:hypothetical protein